MKLPPQLVKYIVKHVEQMLVCYNLTHFHLELVFFNSDKVSMAIEPDLRYLDARLKISVQQILRLWKPKRRKEILYILSHELCHLITCEMSDPFLTEGCGKKLTKQQSHFEERVTEHLSRIMCRLYQKTYKC